MVWLVEVDFLFPLRCMVPARRMERPPSFSLFLWMGKEFAFEKADCPFGHDEDHQLASVHIQVVSVAVEACPPLLAKRPHSATLPKGEMIKNKR